MIIALESVVLGVILLIGAWDSISAEFLGKPKGKDEFPKLKEIWSCGSGDTKVIKVPVRGMITLSGDKPRFGGDAGSADSALLAIRRATHDAKVKAIILDIDSGGGGITASDIIYHALLNFKAADPGRKVVAVFGDVAASGAYYIAMASDHVIARPTSITGSIGVLIQAFDIRGLGEKVGIKNVTIKSGENKDILNPFVELTAEQRAMLQGIVDELHTRFITLVAENRNKPVETIRALADGRIFSASTARDLALVDQIGYWEDVLAKTAGLLGVDTIKVFRYQQDVGLLSLLGGHAMWDPASALYNTLSQSRILYRWPF